MLQKLVVWSICNTKRTWSPETNRSKITVLGDQSTELLPTTSSKYPYGITVHNTAQFHRHDALSYDQAPHWAHRFQPPTQKVTWQPIWTNPNTILTQTATNQAEAGQRKEGAICMYLLHTNNRQQTQGCLLSHTAKIIWFSFYTSQ
jgi:hypothetical protein